MLSKIGLSFTALTIGTVFVINGFTTAGLLLLGAVLYPLAPELVKEAVLERGKEGKNENE